MNVRELGMQIAREQVARAWTAETTKHLTLDPALAEEMAGILYAWVCKVKASEFALEYYKALLGQVDQVLGGDQEVNFANVPGKVMEMMATRRKIIAVIPPVIDLLKAMAEKGKGHPVAEFIENSIREMGPALGAIQQELQTPQGTKP